MPTFPVPDDSETLAQLVAKIQYGSCVSGTLYSPRSLNVTEEAAEHSGFLIQGSPQNSQFQVIKKQDGWHRRYPDLRVVMTLGKFPGFVEFKDAGLDDQPIPYNDVRHSITELVRKGYRGNLCVHEKMETVSGGLFLSNLVSLNIGGGTVFEWQNTPDKLTPFEVILNIQGGENQKPSKDLIQFCLDRFGEPLRFEGTD